MHTFGFGNCRKKNIIIIIISLIFLIIILFYIMIANTYAQISDILVNSIGMRLINWFNFYASSFNLHFSALDSKWLILCLISCIFIALESLKIKHWHDLLVEFFGYKKINNWCYDYPNLFSFLGFIVIVPPMNLTMIRIFIIFPLILKYFYNINIVAFYTWHINLAIYMLSCSLSMALINLINKKYKYGYYTKFSVFSVGLSGSFLLFALIIKFGLYEYHFDIFSGILLGCSWFLEEFLFFGYKLFNYPVITNILSIFKNLFNYPLITNIFLNIKNLFMSIFFKNTLIHKFYSLFKILNGFDLKEVKLNVVDNSDMNIYNSNGNGNGNNNNNSNDSSNSNNHDNSSNNDYNNFNVKRKSDQDHYVYDNNNDIGNFNKRIKFNGDFFDYNNYEYIVYVWNFRTGYIPQFWNSTIHNASFLGNPSIPFEIMASTDVKSITPSWNGWSWGTKTHDRVTYPYIFFDKIKNVPYNYRIRDCHLNELMIEKQKMSIMNISDPFPKIDEILNLYFEFSSQDISFIKSTILDKMFDLERGDSIGKFDDNSRRLIKLRDIDRELYLVDKYNMDRRMFERKDCYFTHADYFNGKIVRDNLFIIDKMKLELLNSRLNIKRATNIIEITNGTIMYFQNTLDYTLSKVNRLGIRYGVVDNFLLLEDPIAAKQEIITAINISIDRIEENFMSVINRHKNLNLNNNFESIENFEKEMICLMNCWRRLEMANIDFIFKLPVNSGRDAFESLKWNLIWNSENVKESEIISIISRKNPEFFQHIRYTNAPKIFKSAIIIESMKNNPQFGNK